jgi:uncharacterized membrane protein YgcG
MSLYGAAKGADTAKRFGTRIPTFENRFYITSTVLSRERTAFQRTAYRKSKHGFSGASVLQDDRGVPQRCRTSLPAATPRRTVSRRTAGRLRRATDLSRSPCRGCLPWTAPTRSTVSTIPRSASLTPPARRTPSSSAAASSGRIRAGARCSAASGRSSPSGGASCSWPRRRSRGADWAAGANRNPCLP